MASPTLESFCCTYNLSDHHHKTLDYQGHAYNVVCIVSSSVSILGTAYHWWPRVQSGHGRHQREVLLTLRQRQLVFWLSLSDILACSGIFLRSLIWLLGYLPLRTINVSDKPDFSHLFCAITSAWVQYFYVSTYFWTFNYALDAFYLVRSSQGRPIVYHLLGWVLPLILCMAGLIPLYTPTLLKCQHNPASLIPHFLSTYIPILLVMMVNPVLYYVAAGSVRGLITKKRAQYTNAERQITDKVKEKFWQIMTVFFLCWVPNIVNGFLLLANNYTEVSRGIFFIVWMIMAVVNPLQAFLNTVVYRGWGGCDFKRPSFLVRSVNNDAITPTTSTEISPLLYYRE